MTARRHLRAAAIGAAGLVAGLLVGPGSSAQARDADVELAYDCDFTSGEHPVRIHVTGAYPDAGTVGRPVQPGRVTARVTLPPAALEGLLPDGTSELAGTVSLTALVTQGTRSAEAVWTLGAPAVPVGDDPDGLTLEHTGEVPSVTATAPGELRIAAGAVGLRLRPVTGGELSGQELPAVDCSPADGQDTLLATVPVTGRTAPSLPADPSPTPGEPGDGASEDPGDGDRDGIAVEQPPAAPPTQCPAEPPADGLDEDFVIQPPPGDPVRLFYPPAGGSHGCAFAVGLANVEKLGGAMIVNDPAATPQLLNARAAVRTATRLRTQPGGAFTRIDSYGEMTLPDAESTFLTFGFQPVSAKVEFITGPITISTATVGSPPDRYNLAVAGFYQSLRVHDVTINGTPLDVGDNCRTARPFPVRLNGDFPDYTNVIIGGPLRGTVTIPEFTGCGTGGEDLDQLFTASLSGPDNLIAMNQGRLCVPSGGGVNGCPPVVPPLPGQEPEKAP
ncbi:DUF6801 domain-containing protein [Streptomyces zhihengii]|uniref:DUF6801 domain-containing protein n=1 Tax=Streptomyces zhihengii TaxID=1818004 RepID=UPI0036AF271C